MIKAEYKIFDDETGEVLWNGVVSPDEVRDYPEIFNVKSNGSHEIVQNGRREYDFLFTFCKYFHEDSIKQTEKMEIKEVHQWLIFYRIRRSANDTKNQKIRNLR